MEINLPTYETHKNIYVNSAVIPPPKIKSKMKHKIDTYKLIIDSRDRQNHLFTTPSKYRVKLEEPFNDVISLQLMDYDISLSRSLINNTNNRLYYNDGISSNQQYLDLSEGSYNGSNLADELKSIQGISTVSYNERNERLTVSTSNNNFQLQFSNSSGNLSSILGFGSSNYSPINSNIVSSQKVNTKPDSYVIMKLENAIANYGNNEHINRSFAILKDNMFKDEIIIKEFNPPLNNFSTFNIEFCDYYGNLYDFGGFEHRLEFCVSTLTRNENVFEK